MGNFVSRTGADGTDAFDSGDGNGFGLFAAAHVHFGVLDAEGVDFDMGKLKSD